MSSLLNPHHGCQICIVVVKSMLWLLWLNLCHLAFVVVTSQSVALLNSYYGCWICIGVVESMSSSFHCCDIPTCGIVELLSWLSNPHCCYWICIIWPSLLNTWYCHQTCVIVVHHPDLDVFAGHLWRLACAENESERSEKKIMGNKNTPCLCDSPSQSFLIANPA